MEHGAVSEGGKRLKFRERVEDKCESEEDLFCRCALSSPLNYALACILQKCQLHVFPLPSVHPPSLPSTHTWTYLKLRGYSTALFM